MWQGKNESAHDYSLRFEAVLDKIPVHEESWVRNIFVWGLHSTIAQEVNVKNPRKLNRAMELAKRADVAITMSRRPVQWDAESQEQKKPAASQQSEQRRKRGYWQNRKQNKNWKSGNAEASKIRQSTPHYLPLGVVLTPKLSHSTAVSSMGLLRSIIFCNSSG